MVKYQLATNLLSPFSQEEYHQQLKLMSMSPYANPSGSGDDGSGSRTYPIDTNMSGKLALLAALNATNLTSILSQDAASGGAALAKRKTENEESSERATKRMILDGLRASLGRGESSMGTTSAALVSTLDSYPWTRVPLSDQSIQRADHQRLQEQQTANLLSMYSQTRLGLSALNSLQQFALGAHQQDQLSTLRNLADLEALRSAVNQQSALQYLANSYAQQLAPTPQSDFTTRLQQILAASASTQNPVANQFSDMLRPSTSTNATLPTLRAESPSKPVMDLPPCEEGRVEPFFKRPMCPLGVDEDPNWLSEFHCFVRSDLVEVFRASHLDVKSRSNSIVYQQVGLRCRFCAHLSPCARAGRGSAFPSSLRQIYQSFTMMLRDHFGNCEAMPTQVQEKFLVLKDQPAQGATDSKRFWIYSAMKIGLADSSDGIIVNERTRAAGAVSLPFGTQPGKPWADDAYSSIPLLLPSDRNLISEFLYLLMSQVQVIRLTESERIGNRRSLQLGLPGFGCRYCCEHRRLGLCRLFPARRRTLPSKVHDIFDHLRRCNLCPEAIKDHLTKTQHQLGSGFHADQGGDREFFDLVWSRLGHGNKSD